VTDISLGDSEAVYNKLHEIQTKDPNAVPSPQELLPVKCS
jgi:hypothetical protein